MLAFVHGTCRMNICGFFFLLKMRNFFLICSHRANRWRKRVLNYSLPSKIIKIFGEWLPRLADSSGTLSADERVVALVCWDLVVVPFQNWVLCDDEVLKSRLRFASSVESFISWLLCCCYAYVVKASQSISISSLSFLLFIIQRALHFVVN
jgi:hypothetical protein